MKGSQTQSSVQGGHVLKGLLWVEEPGKLAMEGWEVRGRVREWLERKMDTAP